MYSTGVLKKTEREGQNSLAATSEISYNERKKRVNYMSEREKAIKLLETIPESKLKYVVDILLNLKELMIEEVEPDEIDLAMIKEAERINDGTTISFDDILEKEGLTYDDLQD